MTSDHSGFVYEVGEWAPCPFCGVRLTDFKEVRGSTRAAVFHPGVITDKDCVMAGRGFCAEERDAWNRRAAPTPAEPSEELRALLRHPAAVHLNMLRGGIAKPSIANIIHLYGEETLREALRAPSGRVEKENPNAY